MIKNEERIQRRPRHGALNVNIKAARHTTACGKFLYGRVEYQISVTTRPSKLSVYMNLCDKFLCLFYMHACYMFSHLIFLLCVIIVWSGGKIWQSTTVTGHAGPEGSRKLRLLEFLTTAQYGGRLSALRTGRLYPEGYSWYSFALGAESTPGPWFGRKEMCH